MLAHTEPRLKLKFFMDAALWRMCPCDAHCAHSCHCWRILWDGILDTLSVRSVSSSYNPTFEWRKMCSCIQLIYITRWSSHCNVHAVSPCTFASVTPTCTIISIWSGKPNIRRCDFSWKRLKEGITSHVLSYGSFEVLRINELSEQFSCECYENKSWEFGNTMKCQPIHS